MASALKPIYRCSSCGNSGCGMTKTLIQRLARRAAATLLALATLLLSGAGVAADTALVFTAPGKTFNEVVSGISGDLEEALNFSVHVLDKNTQVFEITKQITKHRPKVIVLIENNAIKLYAKYQKAHPKQQFVPSVAIAALFVDNFLGEVKNATAIRYEIPAVTSVVNMRSILKQKVRKVGVVHRQWMTPMITENTVYCRAEGIELIAISIPNKSKKLDKQLRNGLKSLLNQKVDALWVINDNALLNSKMLRSAWFPVIKKSKIPVIVGIRPLLNSRWNFGTFAVVPDHYALGVQAASIIEEIMEEGWQIGDREIEQPISVKKIVNITVLNNKQLKYKSKALQNFDEVVY